MEWLLFGVRNTASVYFLTYTHCYEIPYMGNIWWGKILVNYTGKSYWQGKIWRISSHAKTTFLCVCEYWRGKFWQIAHNLPKVFLAKYFLCAVLMYVHPQVYIHKYTPGDTFDAWHHLTMIYIHNIDTYCINSLMFTCWCVVRYI